MSSLYFIVVLNDDKRVVLFNIFIRSAGVFRNDHR